MRAIAILSLLLALGVIGYWIADGMRVYDADQVQEVKVVKDEIFGTETRTVVWKDEFHPGLVWKIGVAGGGLVVVGLGLLLIDRRRRRTAGAVGARQSAATP